MTKDSTFWVEKYRPQTLDDYIFQNEQQKESFSKMIEKQDIQHLLLSGVQGSGKTSMSLILADSLGLDEMDVLKVNCSDEMIEAIRDKVKSFAQTYAFSKFKLVRLEEMDWLSLGGQALLRALMEDYADNCRFIITCNHENKIMPAIKSRCQQFRFKTPPKESVLIRLGEILTLENVEFDVDNLERIVDATYPDIRKTINTAQQYSVDGKLSPPEASESGDYNFQLIDLITKKDIKGVRKLVCENVAREEYESVFTMMYQNVDKLFSDPAKQDEAVIKIAEYLYKHTLVADPEINFAALCIELGIL